MLNYIMILLIMIQYLLILSNLNENVSPRSFPTNGEPLPGIPWFNEIAWGNNDEKIFYNLGVNISQLNIILPDFFIVLLINCYLRYLAFTYHSAEDIDQDQ